MASLFMTAVPLALTGVLTGIYWSVEIHDRRIEALTAPQYMAMHQMRDATFARVMPVFGLGTLFLVITCVAFALAPGWPRWLGAVAVILLVADIIFTIRRQLPVNREIQSWTESTIPVDWRSARDLWASQHRTRLVLCTAAYGALLVAVLPG